MRPSGKKLDRCFRKWPLLSICHRRWINSNLIDSKDQSQHLKRKLNLEQSCAKSTTRRKFRFLTLVRPKRWSLNEILRGKKRKSPTKWKPQPFKMKALERIPKKLLIRKERLKKRNRVKLTMTTPVYLSERDWCAKTHLQKTFFRVWRPHMRKL